MVTECVETGLREEGDRKVRCVWITWEHQRRSNVLAREFKAKFYELVVEKCRILRYPFLLFKTLMIIRLEKPQILFVQSPSIILAAAAALYRKMKRDFVLVVDRHTNFYSISRFRVIDVLLQALGDFALRNTNVTIITNNSLKEIVESRKGFAVVLQDKIPKLTPKEKYHLDGKFTLLYPCSFSVDEPIVEVLKCADVISKDIHIYITGNYKKYKAIRNLNFPENIHFVGFVNEQQYIDYLSSVDCVLALTTWENTLLCCAYEAVSLKKPLILSHKKELCAYFYKGAVNTENNANGIAMAIKSMTAGYAKYAKEITELNQELYGMWSETYHRVQEVIYQRVNNTKTDY